MSAPLHPKTGQFRFGVVAEVDAARARVRVRLPEQSDMLSGWLPVTSALTSGDRVMALPRVGSQVALLTDALCEDGVCLGAIYSDPDPVPVPGGANGDEFGVWFGDGTVLRYDEAGGELRADLSGPQGQVEIAGKGMSTTMSEAVQVSAKAIASTAETMALVASQSIGLSAPALTVSIGSGGMGIDEAGTVTLDGDRVVITGVQSVTISAGVEVSIQAPTIALVGQVNVIGDIDI